MSMIRRKDSEYLRECDTFGIFSTIPQKGDSFLNFLFASMQTKSILKGVFSKRKK